MWPKGTPCYLQRIKYLKYYNITAHKNSLTLKIRELVNLS